MAISATALEDLVTVQVVAALQGRLDLSRRIERPQGDDVEALVDQLADLSRMLGDGEISMAEWQAARGPLQRRIEQAQAVKVGQDDDAVLRRLAAVEGGLAAAWSEMDPESRRALIGLVVADIRISPRDQRWGRTFDPSRVEILWQA
jgi:hypothetical protein